MSDKVRSAGSDEWGTPQALVDLLHDEFGFTIDVCATHENTKLTRFFAPPVSNAPVLVEVVSAGIRTCYMGIDGLAQDWSREVFWMNPPYSAGHIEKWVRKAHEESRHGARGVGLVRHDTSTGWWQRYIAEEAKEIRSTRRRIRFVGAPASYNFPTALVVWDGRAGRGGPRYSYMDLPPEALGQRGLRKD